MMFVTFVIILNVRPQVYNMLDIQEAARMSMAQPMGCSTIPPPRKRVLVCSHTENTRSSLIQHKHFSSDYNANVYDRHQCAVMAVRPGSPM